MKKLFILIVCALFLVACDKKPVETSAHNTMSPPPEGVSGNCIDTLNSFDELVAYMYNDPSSSLYKTKSTVEQTNDRDLMIKIIKTKYSQEICKQQTLGMRESLEKMKAGNN